MDCCIIVLAIPKKLYFIAYLLLFNSWLRLFLLHLSFLPLLTVIETNDDQIRQPFFFWLRRKLTNNQVFYSHCTLNGPSVHHFRYHISEDISLLSNHNRRLHSILSWSVTIAVKTLDHELCVAFVREILQMCRLMIHSDVGISAIVLLEQYADGRRSFSSGFRDFKEVRVWSLNRRCKSHIGEFTVDTVVLYTLIKLTK